MHPAQCYLVYFHTKLESPMYLNLQMHACEFVIFCCDSNLESIDNEDFLEPAMVHLRVGFVRHPVE